MSTTRTTQAILLLITATLCFASQDAITKHLMHTLSASQLVAVRFVFFVLFALWWANRGVGIKVALRSKRPWTQVARGLLLCFEIIIFSYAIQFLGIAEMHTLFACFPLLVTALSVPLLKEVVGWRRWLAVCCGFIGTLIILRPGSDIFQPATLIALLATLMFALYNIFTREVSRHDCLETSLLYVGIVVFISAGAVSVFYWQPINVADATWLLVISTTSIIGHLCLIKALSMVPAVILQPFNYFLLIWAMIIGYLLHGEVLDSITLFGAAIVVASGVFIARREYRLSHQN